MHVDTASLKGLADLQASAWHGYRFAHPMIRVYYFLSVYADRYQKFARMIGRKWALPKFVRDCNLGSMNKRQVTSLIRATFTADAHGIPYDIYIDTMMEAHLRTSSAKPLMPNQLFSKGMIIAAIDAWKVRNETGIYLARAPQFLVENYEAHPLQDAYQNYLCEAVKNKGNKAYYLARLVYDVRHLRIENAKKHFSESVIGKVPDFK